jgi:hypothetical protein
MSRFSALLRVALAGALAGCGSSPPVGNPPVAALKAPSVCDLGTEMSLDATASSDPDGDIVLFRFVVGDGTAAHDETQPTIKHVCRTAGLIEVAVQVIDAGDRSSWARSTVSVRRP